MMRCYCSIFAALALFLVSAAQLEAQSTSSFAVQLAQQSYLTLSGGTSITDITISGQSTYAAGSETGRGQISIQTKGVSMSKVTDSATSVSEIRNDSQGFPSGEWVDGSGAVHLLATHNCWIPAGWILPQNLIQSTLRSDEALSYIGRVSINGMAADQLHLYRRVSTESPAGSVFIAHLSGLDLFLDPVTHVPIAAKFALHPDTDPTLDIPVEIRFSAYRSIEGVFLPSLIQKYFNGNLEFDLNVEAVGVNTGIPDSTFLLQ